MTARMDAAADVLRSRWSVVHAGSAAVSSSVHSPVERDIRLAHAADLTAESDGGVRTSVHTVSIGVTDVQLNDDTTQHNTA
jgi:hypothetical protein